MCRGTNFGLTTQGDQTVRYDNYRSIYRNCTFVEGNLEIVFLERNDFDLSFLSTIKEVTGYVLIVSVFVDTLSLSNLRVIRGRTLYEHDQKYYALYVALNYNPNVITVGLKELQLTSLYGELSSCIVLLCSYEFHREDGCHCRGHADPRYTHTHTHTLWWICVINLCTSAS